MHSNKKCAGYFDGDLSFANKLRKLGMSQAKKLFLSTSKDNWPQRSEEGNSLQVAGMQIVDQSIEVTDRLDGLEDRSRHRQIGTAAELF